jgi:hypothetical protein
MSAVIVTPSVDTAWVRPLATLRPRGVGCQVVWLDRGAFLLRQAEAEGTAADPALQGQVSALADGARTLHHALAEFGVRVYAVPPGVALAGVLAG